VKTEREVLREVTMYFMMAIAAALLIGGAVVNAIDEIDSDMKYTIKTEHGTYHTDNIRVCGKGIAFDTKDKKIIIMGNFNIISNLEQ
jgi:hypothetical protein